MKTSQGQDRDWVGLWYRIAREERGVNDLFTFVKLDVQTNRAVEYVDISHEKMDGLGALTWYLRREGHRVDRVPEGRCAPAPSFWGRVKLFWEFRRVSKNMNVNWAGGDPGKEAWLREIAWEIFTPAETAALERAARTQKLSMNAVLMATLTNVVAPELVRGDDPFYWLFPVNMRGPVKLRDELANASSAVGVACRKGMAISEVQDQIKTQLKKNIHWATWWTVNVGRLVGERGMRWLSARRAEKNFWMGTFSNLGAWPAPGIDGARFDSRHALGVSPPGTVNFPLGFACVLWNGRLVLTLKIHPSVCPDFARVKGFLARTRAGLARFSGYRGETTDARPGAAP